MRIGIALALACAAAAAFAQVTQPGGVPAGSPMPAVAADAGVTGAANTATNTATRSDGGAGRAARTGDVAATPSGQRIYSFDPTPIGGYSFDGPPQSSSGAATSQSAPSSTPR